MEHTVEDAVRRTGISAHTLRYYDRQGLMPFLQRDNNGNRAFDDEAHDYLQLIRNLKNAGMSLAQIREYVDFCVAGDHTTARRLQLLLSQKELVARQITELEKSIAALEQEMDFYRETLRVRF